MSGADHLELGDWNAVCFECGRKRKASRMRKNWQGYYVCPDHWEPRQQQDFARAVSENPTPPWVQPPADIFRLGDTLITESSPTDTPEYILSETYYPITTES